MRARVAVGLGMDEQHGLADLGFKRIVARQRAVGSVEHHMRRRQRPHRFQAVGNVFAAGIILLVVAFLVAARYSSPARR